MTIPTLRPGGLFAIVLLAFCAAAGSLRAEIVTWNFSTNPPLAPSQGPDVWFPDRKAPAEFDSEIFLGEPRLQIGIAAADYDSGNAFYNTQGRKFDIIVAQGGSIEAQLYVPADWETNARRSDLWATGSSVNPMSPTAYMIFGFTSLDAPPRFRVFDSDVGWINLSTTVVYDQWYTLRVDFTGTAFVYSINGSTVFTDSSVNGTTQFHDVMLQAYNPNATYSAHWDNLVIDTALVPEPGTGAYFLLSGLLLLRRRFTRRRQP